MLHNHTTVVYCNVLLKFVALSVIRYSESASQILCPQHSLHRAQQHRMSRPRPTLIWFSLTGVGIKCGCHVDPGGGAKAGGLPTCVHTLTTHTNTDRKDTLSLWRQRNYILLGECFPSSKNPPPTKSSSIVICSLFTCMGFLFSVSGSSPPIHPSIHPHTHISIHTQTYARTRTRTHTHTHTHTHTLTHESLGTRLGTEYTYTTFDLAPFTAWFRSISFTSNSWV